MADSCPFPGVLRVFPRLDSYTPDEGLVEIGGPGLFYPRADEVSEVHVSCTFSWDRPRSVVLARAWGRACPRAKVSLGGPACGDPGGPFVSGLYVKRGVSISSRGCPGRCPWCLVPEREGKLRLYPICPGWIVNDNNVTAWPRARFLDLCAMLREQPRAAVFAGGLEAARIKPWHVDALRTIRVRQLFFAADEAARLPALARVGAMLADLPRRKKRCYVLLGWGGETMAGAEARLERVWELGFMPFAQLYRDAADKVSWDAKWRKFARTWQRPAAMMSMHKGGLG